MGCSCQGPKAFRVEVNGDDYIIWSLDEIVFAVIFAGLDDEAQAEEMLWQKLFEFNPKLTISNEFALRRALLKIYKESKQAYETYMRESEEKAI